MAPPAAAASGEVSEEYDFDAGALIELDLPGYAIGGVSVGEGHELLCTVTQHTAPLLPEDRPRWQIHVIPEFEDDASAFLVHIHHCMGDGIAMIYLTGSDVIRHRLVKEIIRAYARDEGADEG